MAATRKGTSIRVVAADILSESAPNGCVINASHEALHLGSGIAGRLAENNPSLEQELAVLRKRLQKNGCLPHAGGTRRDHFRWQHRDDQIVPADIVHAIPPRQTSANKQIYYRLFRAYMAAFRLASDYGCDKIICPFLGIGVFGIHELRGLEVALGAVLRFVPDEALDEIVFVCNNRRTVEGFQRLLCPPTNRRLLNEIHVLNRSQADAALRGAFPDSDQPISLPIHDRNEVDDELERLSEVITRVVAEIESQRPVRAVVVDSGDVMEGGEAVETTTQEEEKERRKKQLQRERTRRFRSSLSEEEKEEVKKADKEAHRVARASQPAQKRERIRQEDADQHAASRAQLSQESTERIRRENAEQHVIAYEDASPEKKKKKNEERTRNRQREPAAVAAARREIDANAHRQQRLEEDPQRRQARLERDKKVHKEKRKEKRALRKSGTALSLEEEKDFTMCLPELFSLGEIPQCVYCNALTYSGNCCQGGSVHPQLPREQPEVIQDLLLGSSSNAVNFRKNILPYNRAFQMASMSFDREPTKKTAPFVKVDGAIHFNISGLLPPGGQGFAPLFSQIYIYDPVKATDIRMKNPLAPGNMRRNVIEDLSHFFHTENFQAKQFNTMNDVMQAAQDEGKKVDDVIMVLRAPTAQELKKGHPGTLSRPREELVSFVYRNDTAGSPPAYGVWVMRRGGTGLTSIGYFNPLIDPLCYPLIFAYGEEGFNDLRWPKGTTIDLRWPKGTTIEEDGKDLRWPKGTTIEEAGWTFQWFPKKINNGAPRSCTNRLTDYGWTRFDECGEEPGFWNNRSSSWECEIASWRSGVDNSTLNLEFTGSGHIIPNNTNYNVITDTLQINEREKNLINWMLLGKDNHPYRDNPQIYIHSYMLICCIIPFVCSIHVAREISVERETMDYLLVMGMSRSMYFFHHYAIAVLKAIVSIVGISAFLVKDSVLLAFTFYLAFFLFVSGCIAIGICMGATFKKPSVATLSSLIVMTNGPIVAMLTSINRNNYKLALLSYLSPFHALLEAMHINAEAFHRGEQMRWFTEIEYVATFPELIVMMILSNALFLGVAILIDHISSSTDNVWGFHATKLNFCSTERCREHDELPPLENANEIDPQLDRLPVDVELIGIHKTWSTGEHAVRGIDLKLYRGQVTVLLGHNGAGKSTTFAMISGMVVPSAGRMRIGENVIGEGEKAITSSIGFCPQYNPMFPNLTVNENLRFFAMLKGQNSGWKEESERLIRTLQLQDHSNALASTLSGGQKRKLCVAISLVGGSKIILLDEPSAGMDTGARRDMERMLSEYKKERTFLLTTHYTDEAENLGDRILIMSNGQIVCSGTAHFLNQRFGAGYILSAVAKNTSGVAQTSEKLLTKIQEIIPNAHIQRQHGQQIEVWMAKEETPKFAHLFRELEYIGDRLGLESFGLSLNTLEQVFLKVGELTGTRDREGQVRSSISELLELGVLRQSLAALQMRALYDKAHIFSHALMMVFTIVGVLIASMTTTNLEKLATGSIDSSVDLVGTVGHCFRIGVNGSPEFVKKMKNAAATDKSCIINLRPAFAVASFVLRALTGTEINVTEVHKSKLEMDQMNYFNQIKKVIFTCFFLIIVFPSMAWKVVNFYIVDRTSKFAHQQLLTGISICVYWITGFLWDLIMFLFLFAVAIAIMLATGALVDLYILIPMLILSFVVVALRSYLISLVINSKSKANTLVLLSMYILPLVCFGAWSYWNRMIILSRSSNEELKSLTPLEFMDPLFPIAIVYIVGFFQEDFLAYVEEHRDQLFLRNFGCLAVQVLIHIVIFVVLKCIHFNFSKKAPEVTEGETHDAEVEAEKRAIESGQEQDLVLEVNELVKWYGRSCAVRGTSFGVHEHECFGLLGANGAAMHGYSSPWRVADIIVTCVGMDEHGDKKTKSYSGGQRRKISVGIALLAQSSLIILDEPTAGIDPVARRDIWTVLVALRDETKTAIILSSHSMDEVEALCSRVAIMKKGRIVALGSAQSLKSKYGDHYKFSIVLANPEPIEKILDIVTTHFPRAQLEEGVATRTINFEIPRESNHKWSELFNSASEIAEQLGTTDFCLSQATLEDAFVAVAMDHHDAKGPQSYPVEERRRQQNLSNTNGTYVEMYPLLPTEP